MSDEKPHILLTPTQQELQEVRNELVVTAKLLKFYLSEADRYEAEIEKLKADHAQEIAKLKEKNDAERKRADEAEFTASANLVQRFLERGERIHRARGRGV